MTASEFNEFKGTVLRFVRDSKGNLNRCKTGLPNRMGATSLRLRPSNTNSGSARRSLSRHYDSKSRVSLPL